METISNDDINNVQLLIAVLKFKDKIISLIQGKQIVLVFGRTVSGKSITINWMMGAKFQEELALGPHLLSTERI